MFRSFVLTLLFSVFSALAWAQQPPVQPDSVTNPVIKYPTPYDHIQNLKKGALLVRLKTRSSQIEALQNLGKTALANQVKYEQQQKNQLLINAFKKYYTFSPVYFFYADDSEKILARQFDGIILNVNLEPAFRNGYFPGRFLVAEIGLIGNSSAQFNTRGERIDDVNQNSTIEGLIISDENLVQLSDPFPYSVRSFHSLGKDLRRSEDRMVQKLNERFIEFARARPGHYQYANFEKMAEAETENQKKGVSKFTVIVLSVLVTAGIIYRVL